MMPDWEIVRWDETNFDLLQSEFCRQAYEAKRWAFVSDYIRVNVMYNFGGIYLDVDEEMIQPLYKFALHKAFFGMEAGNRLQGGLFGCEKNSPVIGEILVHYNSLEYIKNGQQDNTVIGTRFVEVLQDRYPHFQLNEQIQELEEGVFVYPSRYFCPDLATLKITEESFTIHRPMGSWLNSQDKLKKYIYTFITKIKPFTWLYCKIKR